MNLHLIQDFGPPNWKEGVSGGGGGGGGGGVASEVLRTWLSR